MPTFDQRDLVCIWLRASDLGPCECLGPGSPFAFRRPARPRAAPARPSRSARGV